MALEPQEIEVPLALGMATKPSAELQDPTTSMRLVQNLHWRGQGEIERRPTHEASVTVTAPSGSLYTEADACGLIRRGEDVCMVSGHHGVMPYSTLASAFKFMRPDQSVGSSSGDGSLKYAPVSYDLSRQLVHSAQWSATSNGIHRVASAQYNGIQVIAWIEPALTTRLRLKAIDPFTGTVLATTDHDTLSGLIPTLYVDACEYTESGKEGVLVAYIDGSGAPYTVKTVRYDAATNEFVADSNLTTDSGKAFTLAKNGNRIYFGYHKNTGGVLTVEDRTIGAITTTHTGTHSAEFGVAIVKGTNRTLIVSCTSSDAYAEVFGTPANVITSLTADASETFYGIACARETLSGTTDDAVVYVNAIIGSSKTGLRVRAEALNFDATTVTENGSQNIPHCRTVGAFTLRGRAHVMLVVVVPYNSAAVGRPCFVARWRGHTSGNRRHDVVAKVLHDRMDVPFSTTFENTQNGVYVDSSNNAWIVSLCDPTPDGTGSPNGDFSQSIFLCRLSAARPMPMPCVELTPSVTMVAGAMPWEFDGETASEIAPLVTPVIRVDTASAGGESATTGYSFRAVYRWVDRAGRLHQVAGPAVSTGAFTTQQLDVYVSRCPLATYEGTTTTAIMEVDLYCTTDGGSVYFLLEDAGGGSKLAYTSLTSDGLWFKFTDIDAQDRSDITNPILEGTEIEPEPTPGFSYVAKVVDRAWAIDAEDRSRIWFSKPLVSGYGAEWSTANTLTIDDECVAVVDMGGGAMVLARGGIYLVDGEGPDATGAGGFSPARKLNSTVDCIDPVSVCRTPLGVVFRGRRGFYVLNGSDAQPFGVPIDPEVLTDPALDPSVSAQYRMRVVYQEQTSELHISGIPGGDRLVYNLLEQKWSKYDATGVEVRDLAVARGKVWHLNRISSADVLRDDLLYSHSGTSYNASSDGTWTIETPWLRLDRVGGMQRLWRAWLCLYLPSDVAGIGTISLAYYVNDIETVRQTVSWTGAELAVDFAPSTSERVVRLPFVPMGDCQAVTSAKFVITCSFAGSTGGPKPLALRLRVGMRPSLSKRNKLVAKG